LHGGAATRPRPRDPAWQDPQRRREQLVRTEAVALVTDWRAQQVPAREAAALLDVPPRTLRQWQHDLLHPAAVVPYLGRPHRRATPVQADAAIACLQQRGPWIGLPSLRGLLPDVPRAELHDLLGIYRFLWSQQHPRWQALLHWHRPGTVWAMDFTRARFPIDGLYPYLLAVRDLASGFQLAWQPVSATTSAVVVPELVLLFTVYGAPLVLKSDNGSAFRDEALQRWLRRWQVWPLYSPPGQPGYNGAIEASIGSLKKRTQFQAERAGQPLCWTGADLDRARTLVNEETRRQVAGPTPAAAWQARQPLTEEERDAWSGRVQGALALARQEAGLALDAELSHYEQAALHRRVLEPALVESGLLTITRRRLPQLFFGRKPANIW
jgi:hypothetical protein